MSRLAGKRVFITGGGSGIGRACAKLFTAEGASVAIAGRRRAELESVASEIHASGGRCVAVTCDVTDRGLVENAVREAVTAFGGLDVVVNNAGTNVLGTVEQTSDEDWSACWPSTSLARSTSREPRYRNCDARAGVNYQHQFRLWPRSANRTGGLCGVEGRSDAAYTRHGSGSRAGKDSRELHLSRDG